MTIKILATISLVSTAVLVFSACTTSTQTTALPQETPQTTPVNHQAHSMAEHIMTMTVANDEEFLSGMIPHHQEAVDTSKYLFDKTPNAELKKFLTQLIDAQTKEIETMKTWYKQFFGREYVDNDNYMPMMGDLTAVSGKELEKLYLEGMIQHHQGAVQMADSILPKAEHPEIKKMAEDIQKTQSAEITLMQEWLKHY